MRRPTPLLVLLLFGLFASWVSAGRSTRPLFANRPSQYASKYIKAIEPLQGFSFTHSKDRIPLAGFHPEAPPVAKPEPHLFNERKTFSTQSLHNQPTQTTEAQYTTNDLEHWSVYGAPHSYYKGQAQLYPDRVQLQFLAFGERIEVELHIIRDLFNEHSRTTLMNGDQVVSEHRHVLQSYWSSLADGSGWATATLHRNGQFQAIVHRDGDTIQVDPVTIHKQDMSEKAYLRLHAASHHHTLGHPNTQKGMVVHRHSDFVDISESHQAGAMHVEASAKHTNASFTSRPISPYSSTSRRLLDSSTIAAGYGSFPTSTSGMTGWTDCYFGDSDPQRLSVGFAVDTGMYQVWGSVVGVQQYIAWQMSVTNLVYLTQLHMFLTISDTWIESAVSSTAAAWNDVPPSTGSKCTIDINTKLKTFSSWRGTKQSTRNSIWNLQTNCYPPSGTVGLAWIGVLCNTYYATSISTYTSNQWLTTAHEIGHNFGASHTFALGVGTTGGIMDYGDGKLDGIYQFYTKYSKVDMCDAMANTAYAKSFTPYCVTSYTSTCGNGIVEPGEVCDDTTSCCGQPGTTAPCQLTSTSQCSGETPCCSGCQYKPSTTTCLNGKGYCQNGFCAAAACVGYTGLSFCGMVSTNACRQQCLSSTSGTCSSSYSAPNLNVPDGVVCATSPYSTCSGGQCVASGSSVTYAWSTSEWTTCDCDGTQGRVAYCMGSDGSVSANTASCNAATKPALTQTCTVPSTCTSYEWSVSTFSSCSVDCGGGIQTATIKCIASDSQIVVTDSACTTTKPTSTQSCSTQTCESGWKYSDWSACSVGCQETTARTHSLRDGGAPHCGGGTRTRTAACQQTQNGIVSTVSSTYCSNVESTSQSCNTQPCTVLGSNLTYSITYGVWSECSATCGSGTQSRDSYCVGSDGTLADVTICGCGVNTSITYCPDAIQSCNTDLCPSYSWVNSSWSDCSVKCGGGIQTRSVQCMNTVVGIAVSTANCVLTQPSGVQSCNTQTCSVYHWNSDVWSACSATCGGGTQTRTISCLNEAGTTVANAYCTATTPATTQTCNAQTCPTYQWIVGEWSTCSAWCGGGTQTRTVKCVAIGSLTSVAYSNCDTSNIPATAQYCNQGVQCPINSDTQWKLSDWSDCSTICGGDGIRNRTVVCLNSTTGVEVDSKYCPVDYVPEVSSTCENVTCPTYWHTSAWSTCTAECGGGSQTRTVACRYVNTTDGTNLDDALCTGTRPSEKADCNIFSCPSWLVGDWSACSSRCGDGEQTRQVSCVTWDNQNTTEDQCASTTIPIRTQTCFDMPCPHWHRGPWSYCDKPCGSGNQTRSLVCRLPHDDIWYGQIVEDETLCPGIGVGDTGDGVGDADVTAGKPTSWQLCNTAPCPNYYWDVQSWSACSVTCGGGTQSGEIVCRSSSEDGLVVSSSLCLGTPISSERVCNEDSCPTYDWYGTTSWSNCSVICGSGFQTRRVSCVDTTPATWKNVSYEITTNETLCANRTKLPSKQTCAFTKSVCWGTALDATSTVANGLCTADGECLCRAGWAGTYCQETPNITNVRTNGPSFSSAGIAFGDKLQIYWDSVGSLPYVSILLIRDQSSNASLNWPVASYIARGIINSGSYQWSIGSTLSDLESGDGFSIRIWFSSQIWGETTTPFVISDPCSYKSCGTHGTCGIGGVCTCVNGYSGETCSLGPCERALCSTSFGSCNNDLYIGLPTTTSETVGICLCGQNSNGYFDGYQCRTPPGCTPRCENGGDLFNVIVDLDGLTSEEKGQCGICGCLNMWGGDNCQNCTLRCAHGGLANENCTACDCTNAPGYFGSTCDCKLYSLKIRLNLESTFVEPSTWIEDPISSARFARTLAIDLALASGQTTGINVQINVLEIDIVEDEPYTVMADVQFGIECPTLSQDVVGTVGGMARMDTESAKALRGISTSAAGADSQVFNNLLSRSTLKNKHYSAFYPSKAASEVSSSSSSGGSASGSLGPSTGDIPSSIEFEDGRPVLLTVYQVVAAMFEDLSSPLYRGVITSNITLATIVNVTDPTGEDKPVVPSVASDPFQLQQSDSTPTDGSDGGGVGSSSKRSSLSTGAIVGICVGSVCALILVVGIFCLWRAKRFNTKTTSAKSAGVPHYPIEPGTELVPTAPPSLAPSPAATPHDTPPQRERSIEPPQPRASPSIPPPSQRRDYAASPSADPDERYEHHMEISTEHVNFA